MKTFILAALAIVATVAPLHAKKVKSQTFIVKEVTVVSVSGSLPKGAAKFKKGATVKLKISPKKLTGPKKISMLIESSSITSDVYREGTGTLQYTLAKVNKNTTTQKAINVDLTFFGPAKVFGNVTAAGQVSYTLVPKTSKK